MGRRIEVELTSERDDGTWTWRAAGAKQPKGELSASLLYQGAKVGDVVKADATFHLDGIEVTEVMRPKAKKERTDLLEMKLRPLRDEELVTTQRVSRGGGRDRDRGGRGGDRPNRGRGRERSNDRRRPSSNEPQRPKPKRLRARRVHRDALLEATGAEHRPIVEQVIKDGMPGVRAAIEKQNTEAKAAGKPEVEAAPIMAIAEKNLQKARLAEWRDKADAAIADAAELDLRDLRSVVVVGSDLARDDESKAIADQLKSVLDERMESDHAAWLSDLQSAVGDGRVVRGLRLSSRPVKAGAPLPTDLATELATQASNALAADTMADRWVVLLDALAFSPVRGAVTPAGVPESPSEDLVKEVRRLSDRIPAIAALFGIDPASVSKSEKRRRSPGRDRNRKGKGGAAKGDRPKGAKAEENKSAPKPQAAAPAGEAPTGEPPVAETPVTETPVTETPVTETPVAETPAAETPVTETDATDDSVDTGAAETATDQADTSEEE